MNTAIREAFIKALKAAPHLNTNRNSVARTLRTDSGTRSNWRGGSATLGRAGRRG